MGGLGSWWLVDGSVGSRLGPTARLALPIDRCEHGCRRAGLLCWLDLRRAGLEVHRALGQHGASRHRPDVRSGKGTVRELLVSEVFDHLELLLHPLQR